MIAAAVLTSGFGLLGGDDGSSGGGKGKHHGGQSKPDKVEVAVLNATQEETVGGGEVVGVPGLAGEVAKQVVKPAGFKIGEKTDAVVGLRADDGHVRAEPRPGRRRTSPRPSRTSSARRT